MFLVFNKTQNAVGRYVLISLICLFDVLFPFVTFGSFAFERTIDIFMSPMIFSFVIASQISILLTKRVVDYIGRPKEEELKNSTLDL